MQATMGLQREINSRLPPEEAIARYRSLVAESFEASKWYPINHSPNSATFGSERFHTWQIAAAILLFPVGILALLGEKQSHWVNAVFVEHATGSTIVITGAVSGDSQIEAMLDHVESSIDADTLEATRSQA
jgi:hypothetical protein